jgi:hypothetical protein
MRNQVGLRTASQLSLPSVGGSPSALYPNTSENFAYIAGHHRDAMTLLLMDDASKNL